MTNETIILNERFEAMEKGIIGTTGRIIEIETEEGKKMVPEPEEMHTFAAWKQLGYMVSKGEKAKVTTYIWKKAPKKQEKEQKTEEPENSDTAEIEIMKKFVKVKAFLFSASQVKMITA